MLLFAASEAAARPAPRPPERGWWQVRGVPSDDQLNVRAAPGSASRRLGVIPPDAVGVQTTGRSRRGGGALWVEVKYGRVQGWVNARYLVAAGSPGGEPAPEPRPAAGQSDPRSSSDAAAVETEAGQRPSVLPDGMGERLVCYFDDPMWKLQIDGDGSVRCSEWCQAPTGLRVARGRRGGEDGPWRLRVEASDGRRFLEGALRRSPRCVQELIRGPNVYEIRAARGGGRPLRGCCYPTSSKDPGEGPRVRRGAEGS